MESAKPKLRLHSFTPLRRRLFNKLFALIYSAAISALLYHHVATFLSRRTTTTVFIFLAFLISDLILAFMWVNLQACRMNPIATKTFPENLLEVLNRPEEFPALDVFVCTADPYKEPPVTVVATVLSAMAYDYPAEKLSVYVSDDGWSQLSLFALMEAVEFGKVWLPFCKANRVMERSPEAYFRSGFAARNCDSRAEKIKEMYDNMKTRIENVVERGYIADEYKTSLQKAQAFGKWTKGFTSQDHPAVIQVISQNSEDKDVAGCSLPNLIYVSREKSKTSPHHFKAGALNVLLRVSAVMTNSPIILTLDCDMISNDPSTPHRMLCFLMDNSIKPNLAYVQFPMYFKGLNKADIYGAEYRRMHHINAMGLNGLLGPDYFGTGTFFNRRAFYGGPLSMIEPEVPELSPDHVVKKPINDQATLELAHHVASYDYENQSKWGSKIGFRYGSLVEDFYSGYQLHCEGWRSIFYRPERPAFLCEMPISLHDVVIQLKRWAVGLLEVALSKCSPLTFGKRFIGPLMAHCYSYYAFGPIWSLPIMIYAFLPQITMLNNISIFPKVSDPWFFLYTFLFLGAYLQDFFEFILSHGTILRWWSDQRIWLVKGLSSDLFGTLEYISHHLGISSRSFNVTNKTNDNELRKRYDKGMFEFAVPSPIFVPLSTAAIVNLTAFLWGIFQVLRGKYGLFGQVVIAGFGVVNSWPIYEAMVLRRDEGRMPTKITLISGFLAWVMFVLISFIVKM